MTSLAFTYGGWDEKIANRRTDFQVLFNQMHQMSYSPIFQNDVEIWWRLALVAMQVAGNIDINTDRPAKVAKITEAKNFAERALSIDAGHFQANLWMAVTIGDLAILQPDMKVRLLQVRIFAEHLRECIRQQADHWRVLLMEANLHLRLWHGNAEAKAAIRASPGLVPATLPRFDLPEIERKLRRSLQLKPDFLHTYWSLFTVLIKQSKYAEALQIGQQGTALDRTLVDENQMAQQLERWIRYHQTRVAAGDSL